MESVNKDSGGANELRKHLEDLGRKIQSGPDIDKIIIGIFDNDAKGNQEFGGLNQDFLPIDSRLKKFINKSIYALKLPIPNDDCFKQYIQEKQEFKFFSIENYFPVEYLKGHNMVTMTPINDVYEITGKKTEFASIVQQENDENLFKYFPVLLRVIDDICGKSINYIE